MGHIHGGRGLHLGVIEVAHLVGCDVVICCRVHMCACCNGCSSRHNSNTIVIYMAVAASIASAAAAAAVAVACSSYNHLPPRPSVP